MKRTLSLVLSAVLIFLLLPFPACAEKPASAENRIVLTIGDNSTRSGPRYKENLETEGRSFWVCPPVYPLAEIKGRSFWVCPPVYPLA